VGVLCGLGYDPDSAHSIFPEHDMEVMFDTLITPEDLNQVGGAEACPIRPGLGLG